MIIKKKVTYELIKKDIPTILNNVVRKDCNVGGIKLVYKIKTSLVKEYNFLGTIIYIPTFSGILKETRIFLRPFKEEWDTERNRLPTNFWGKKSHPLTNLWLELAYDYENIHEETPLFKEEIRNHNLIKLLRHNTNKFSIFTNL